MMRMLWTWCLCGCLACSEAAPPSQQDSSSEPVAATAELKQPVPGEVYAPPSAPAASAVAPDCSASAAEGCEDVMMQLEAARRSLTSLRAERAQRPGMVNVLIRFVVQGRPLSPALSFNTASMACVVSGERESSSG